VVEEASPTDNCDESDNEEDKELQVSPLPMKKNQLDTCE